MNLINILLLFSFASETQAINPPTVVLFGGVGATSGAMKSCSGQNFRNIGYKQGWGKVEQIVKEINSSTDPEQRWVIAGHSSGAKYSNSVGWQIKKSKLKQVAFVSLDGFSPRDLQYRAKTECWLATNGRKVRSKNAKYMTKQNCGVVKKFEAPHCKTQWCLHFALVNTVTPKNLGAKSFRSRGYENCEANTAWMNPWGGGQ